MMQYAEWLLKTGNSSYVERSLWPIIQLDLDYVSTSWRQPTSVNFRIPASLTKRPTPHRFDLWEEINSESFFTAAVQHRSLREGSSLAVRLQQHGESQEYSTQADGILCFMRVRLRSHQLSKNSSDTPTQPFWNPDRAYMRANTGGGRSGLDSNTVLASIHTFDPSAGCDSATFQPCSDLALSNLKEYVDSFRRVYALNKGAHTPDPVATGRYPEDVYFGGNVRTQQF